MSDSLADVAANTTQPGSADAAISANGVQDVLRLMMTDDSFAKAAVKCLTTADVVVAAAADTVISANGVKNVMRLMATDYSYGEAAVKCLKRGGLFHGGMMTPKTPPDTVVERRALGEAFAKGAITNKTATMPSRPTIFVATTYGTILTPRPPPMPPPPHLLRQATDGQPQTTYGTILTPRPPPMPPPPHLLRQATDGQPQTTAPPAKAQAPWPLALPPKKRSRSDRGSDSWYCMLTRALR